MRSEDHLYAIVPTPLHPQKATTWCALRAEGIIGSYFFENDAGHKVTANNERFRAVINEFFVPKLDVVDVKDLWLL